ncbi:hypothetical protein TSMEX_003000 [Taenia solium]|eukprot:TsM_000303700 transcript=TsM_000303700 gene=TsM_000303700
MVENVSAALAKSESTTANIIDEGQVRYVTFTSNRDYSTACCSTYALESLPLVSSSDGVRADARCMVRLVVTGRTFHASLVLLSSTAEGKSMT